MKKETQLQQVKRHLLKGLSISTFEAIVKYKITRLSEHICTLRHKFNYPISDEWVVKGKESYKIYFIKEENL